MQLKPKILVVDDSLDVLHVLNYVLSHCGYKVEVAEDGETALQKCMTFRPNIVTLDLGMPRTNGFKTLHRILEIDRNAKVIITTASPNVTLEECLKSGAAGLITKPFKSGELIRTIGQTLDHMKIGH